MVLQTKKKIKLKKNSNKIKYMHGNILKLSFKKSDLITSYYTIQFIHPKFRQEILIKYLKT